MDDVCLVKKGFLIVANKITHWDGHLPNNNVVAVPKIHIGNGANKRIILVE